MKSDLKQRLKALDLSVAEFARRIDVHPGTVWRWIGGEIETPGSVRYLLDALERLKRIQEIAK